MTNVPYYYLMSVGKLGVSLWELCKSSQLACGSKTILYVARQAPLSVKSFRQEYWSGLPFPSPGDLEAVGGLDNWDP